MLNAPAIKNPATAMRARGRTCIDIAIRRTWRPARLLPVLPVAGSRFSLPPPARCAGLSFEPACGIHNTVSGTPVVQANVSKSQRCSARCGSGRSRRVASLNTSDGIER